MREEQEEQLCRGRDKRKRTDCSSQSSGSGEEEEEGRREKEKGRKENAPNNKSLVDYPGIRMFPVGRQEGGEEKGRQEGGRSRLGAPGGLKTTAPPFRSSLLLLPRTVSTPVAGQRLASPGSQ